MDEARGALEPLLANRLTQRVATLMARIEAGDTGDKGKVREWLARAANGWRRRLPTGFQFLAPVERSRALVPSLDLSEAPLTSANRDHLAPYTHPPRPTRALPSTSAGAEYWKSERGGLALGRGTRRPPGRGGGAGERGLVAASGVGGGPPRGGGKEKRGVDRVAP